MPQLKHLWILCTSSTTSAASPYSPTTPSVQAVHIHRCCDASASSTRLINRGGRFQPGIQMHIVALPSFGRVASCANTRQKPRIPTCPPGPACVFLPLRDCVLRVTQISGKLRIHSFYMEVRTFAQSFFCCGCNEACSTQFCSVALRTIGAAPDLLPLATGFGTLRLICFHEFVKSPFSTTRLF